MDYNQGRFYMQQFDAPKIPFYMSYPMQSLYLTEMEYEKDMDRMKELYPKGVRHILDAVEEECDKMEYEGSLMFDEYPDRYMLERVTDRIYEAVKKDDNDALVAEEISRLMPPGNMPPQNRPMPPGSMPPPPPPPPRRNDPLRDLIGVMLNNEMYRRRCRHRRCRRWW